jgi:hypothetical protein
MECGLAHAGKVSMGQQSLGMRVKCQRFHRSASPHGIRLQRVGERVWERGRVGWSHRHWRPSPSPSHKRKSKSPP